MNSFYLIVFMALSLPVFASENINPELMSLSISVKNGDMRGSFTRGASIAADLTFFFQRNGNSYTGYFEDGFGNVYSFRIAEGNKTFTANVVLQKDARVVRFLAGKKPLIVDNATGAFEWRSIKDPPADK
jgi:hypothetical protein